MKPHTLIPAGEALKILTFVSYDGLRRGSRGTDVLTRFPHNLFSREECVALRDSIIDRGISLRDRKAFDRREIPTELV